MSKMNDDSKLGISKTHHLKLHSTRLERPRLAVVRIQNYKPTSELRLLGATEQQDITLKDKHPRLKQN